MEKNNILYFSIVLYLIFSVLGGRLGWAVFQYDELRLLQFPLALCALLALFFEKKIEYSIFTQTIFFLIGILIVIQLTNYNIFQFQELWSVIVLLFILSTLAYTFKDEKNITHGMVLIVISALIPCLFILISIVNFIIYQQWFDWQFNSGTIRIFDSVIVPIFFFAIFLKTEKYRYINYLYPTVTFFFTLAWLFDGARSALLAVMTGLLFLFISSRQNRNLILQTIGYMLFAFLVHKGVIYLADKNTMTVLRTGTSLRSEMWLFMFEQWKNSPFLGVGGGYLSKIQYSYGHHIHNLYLRLVFEWGVVGVIFLVWMIYQLFGLFRAKEVTPVAKAGVAAILVDAMFSGSMVYPASQIACVLFIAFAFSQKRSGERNLQQFYGVTKILLGLWMAMFLYITIVYLGQDLTCWNCESYIGRMAPNFWEYGGTEHLIPARQIP
ncbi:MULTISPECIES: O-antigen ligase family protein [Acinetobacter]|uniref:O-antigen ligase family protein n=1 Tax=Acinetobacter TaxID=469 RepID=UPI00281494BE|nr:O-antigen ligase family protein [Acinetobacter sp. 12966]MDQ9949449.1 O-antigen ligase family protein [Acinetobacter sp. 12966]